MGGRCLPARRSTYRRPRSWSDEGTAASAAIIVPAGDTGFSRPNSGGIHPVVPAGEENVRARPVVTFSTVSASQAW